MVERNVTNGQSGADKIRAILQPQQIQEPGPPFIVTGIPFGVPRFHALTDDELGFIGFDPEVSLRMDQVTNGTRKQREQAQRWLVKRVVQGSTDDLLDVTIVLGTAIVHIISPGPIDIKTVGINPNITADSLRSARGLLEELLTALSANARSYPYSSDRISTLAKLKFADTVVQRLSRDLPGFKLSDQLNEYSITLASAIESMKSKPEGTMLWGMGPFLGKNEIDRIERIAKDESSDMSQDDFNLLIKGVSIPSRSSVLTSATPIKRQFQKLDPKSTSHTLKLLNSALRSSDPAVKNCAFRALVKIESELMPMVSAQIEWFQGLQAYISRMADGDQTLDPDIVIDITDLALAFASAPDRIIGPEFLLRDFKKLLSPQELPTQDDSLHDQQLIDKILNSKVDDSLFGLLIRSYRSFNRNTISRAGLLELFDKRRPLGYFLENLEASWQDLQRITREGMWPSFISERQARLWPSERELDILSFSGNHPANVLGFRDIRFFTHGFVPPEVGLEFTFKHTESVLGGRLNKDGRLAGFPVNQLETHNPMVHTFLEHIAVGSFEELVTVAERRIQVVEPQIPSRVISSDTEDIRDTARPYEPSLPRREVSYITLSPTYLPQVVQSDEIIERARERERLPKLISQKVVPLAYAQRYRYWRGLLDSARVSGASTDELKDLEGRMLSALSLVKRPSRGKLNNLPDQFQLERTFDGRYLDTWRIEHLRPKPQEGEEHDLPTVFQKRFRAVPISLTRHLETWFTQPPR